MMWNRLVTNPESLSTSICRMPQFLRTAAFCWGQVQQQPIRLETQSQILAFSFSDHLSMWVLTAVTLKSRSNRGTAL
eukprot:3352557-Amphidinium_carterae.3